MDKAKRKKMMIKIGIKIRKARKDKGLTLKDLSEKIGVHFSTLNQWELGVRNIYGVELIELNKKLDNKILFL